MNKIIIVTGLARSGTTLTTYCIGEHSQAWHHEESWLFRSLSGPNHQWRDTGLITPAEIHHSLTGGIGLVYSSMLAKKKKKFSVEKCPPLSCQYPHIRELARDIGVHWVWLHRSPHDTLASWCRRFSGPDRMAFRAQQYHIHKPGVRMSVTDAFTELFIHSMANMQQALMDGNCTDICYEKFVTEPEYRESKLRTVFSLMGVEDESKECLEKAANSDGSPETSDDRFAHWKGIYTNSVGSGIQTDPELCEQLDKSLEKYGVKFEPLQEA